MSTLKRNRRNKKCMNTVLDLSMVKKNKESWARSSCSTEEERKAKCCSLLSLKILQGIHNTCQWEGTSFLWLQGPEVTDKL